LAAKGEVTVEELRVWLEKEKIGSHTAAFLGQLEEAYVSREGGDNEQAMFDELASLHSAVQKEDYYLPQWDAWDVGGLKDDLVLAKSQHQAISNGREGLRLFGELEELHERARREDYFDFAANEWDLEGLKGDLAIAKGEEPPRKQEDVPQKQEDVPVEAADEAESDDCEKLLAQLTELDPQASREDYYLLAKDFWDIEALKEDLQIARSKAGLTEKEVPQMPQAPQELEAPQELGMQKHDVDEEDDEDWGPTHSPNFDPEEDDWPEDTWNWTEEEAFNATGPSLVERRLMGRPDKFQDVTRFIGVDPTLWMEGNVTALHGFGVFAEVHPPKGGEEMIGFLHAARIRQGFIENRENIEKEFWVGQKIRVRIVYVDEEFQRLALTQLENEDHLDIYTDS